MPVDDILILSSRVASKDGIVRTIGPALIIALTPLLSSPLLAQEYGAPGRGQPGDFMIQNYLKNLADGAPTHFLEGVRSAEDWRRLRPRYKEEYFYMLGLWPLPARTPLEATVTGTIDGDGFVVLMGQAGSSP